MNKIIASVIAFFQWFFVLTPAEAPKPYVPSTVTVTASVSPRSVSLTATPSPVLTAAVVPAVSSHPASYDEVDFYKVKALLGLEDKTPPMPPDGFENGLEIHFRERQNPRTLTVFHHMLVEDHAFLCGMADQNNWREYGSHNSYVERKYGIDPMTDDISSYYNLLAQNPGGLYDSQRNDLIKVRKHYCGDRRDTQLGF